MSSPTLFHSLEKFKDLRLWTVRAQSSSDSQDGVVGLSGPTHLNVAEADLVEHVAVVGQWAFPTLSLHQHVEGEKLSHDGPSSVLKQQGLHQQDAATCQEDKVSECRTLGASGHLSRQNSLHGGSTHWSWQNATQTWSAGVVDPLQQGQALLFRPVMNDSGQNVQVGRRNVISEEISCIYNRK